MQSPHVVYEQEIQKHQDALNGLLKKSKRLGWLRLFVFILTIIVSYEVFVSVGAIGVGAVLIGIAILLYLVSLHTNNSEKIKHTQTLIQVNEEELQVLNNQYQQRYDGSLYLPALHPYAHDLDLFGKASLYQYINRCYTEQGRSLLAQNLLTPLPLSHILGRQEAAKELAANISWRQQLQALAMQTPITKVTEQRASAWLAEQEVHFIHPAWKRGVTIYTFITVASAIAAVLGFIPTGLFSFLFLIYFFTALLLSRHPAKAYASLTGIVGEISTLQQIVQWIEEASFQSSLLTGLQQSVQQNNEKAFRQIKSLKAILDRFDTRLSIVGILFLNPFLLWDVRQMIALNNWRRHNKALLATWFQMVAEMEVVNSLCTLYFNQPHWCMPAFSDEHFTIEGTAIGHPLIPAANRVTSDFSLQGTATIALITGSNMAGKSTFLRSLGINIVLAQLGAPVCAQQWQLSPVQVMSSMRIADNLAENTSTFYAELKKLKTIIEAVNRHERVFILLDEILRGTNSLDRHTGSEALMKQLIKEEAVAVIATHDIELATIETAALSSLQNYHFDVQVAGEELYFDYKLKEGICTSLNASILMKKIGIDLS